MICGYNHGTLEYIIPIDVHIIKKIKDVYMFENYLLMDDKYRITTNS